MEQYRDYIKDYLAWDDWLIKENANKFESYTKLRGYIADEQIKPWILNNIYTEKVKKAHVKGDFHIHDLADGLVPYCKGHDAAKILMRGLITQTVVSKRPKHLCAAFNQLMNMLAYNQQQWAGAMAISNINTLLSPFVRTYLNELINLGTPVEIAYLLTKKYVKQAVQSFTFDLNFPSRAGSQTPFSNITLNLTCPEFLKEQPVYNAGCEGVYGDYEMEARMIMEAFDEIFYVGDAKGMPFTFPIVTINLLPDTDFNDPLWEKLIKTELKFGTYSFFNYIGSGLDPNSVYSMCCRFQANYEDVAQAGGRWAYQGETGSIGVVTLNMPRLGYLAADKEDFFKRLTDLMNLAKNSLLSKGVFIEQHKQRFMPMDVEYGTDLTRFFRTIAVLGLNEMCLNFLGKPLSESQNFVQEVLEYMKTWVRQTQQDTQLYWNIEMVPGEGCATRLAMLDKKMFPDIITQGTDGARYYTNMLTPPNQDLSLPERIRAENDLLGLFSGGTVFRIYIKEFNGVSSPEGIKKLIMRIAQKTKLPYFDIAPSFSICPACGGYHYGVVDKCRLCDTDEKPITFDRIVGYYRPRSQANIGKLQEITERLSYSLIM